MSIAARVRAFITSNFYVADQSALAESDSLLDKGIVDSTGVLEIVAFLEKEFGMAVDDSEILPENLDSIANIAAYVGRKQG